MRTPGMEDYLEQIYQLVRENGFTRISDVAAALSVNNSSVSKMAQRLVDEGYVTFEKYGRRIALTVSGLHAGEKLLRRHQLLEAFLRQLGVSEKQIEAEVEELEHHISWETLERIEHLVMVINEQSTLKTALRDRQQQI